MIPLTSKILDNGGKYLINTFVFKGRFVCVALLLNKVASAHRNAAGGEHQAHLIAQCFSQQL
jgi:hypothetical protein